MVSYWLSILVITILVSLSEQGYYDPPVDIYSYKRGYPNEHPYILKGFTKENLELYSPIRYIMRNTESPLDLRHRNGRNKRLKLQQQEDSKKLKKLSVKKAVPPLVVLLNSDADNFNVEDK